MGSAAFVSSLANSKSIFLTFFYLLPSHTTSLFVPLPSLLLLYQRYSSVHLYSAQMWASPIASLYLILGYFLSSLLSLLAPPSICSPPPHLLHLITAHPICSCSLRNRPGSRLWVHIRWMVGIKITLKLFHCTWVWDNSNI